VTTMANAICMHDIDVMSAFHFLIRHR